MDVLESMGPTETIQIIAGLCLAFFLGTRDIVMKQTIEVHQGVYFPAKSKRWDGWKRDKEQENEQVSYQNLYVV